ncbi:MAG: hypothetical protein AAGD13_08480 [Pseudomonadota bacterium]
MANPDTTLTIYFCGSGNNLTAYKAHKHAVPQLCKVARNRHIGYDGPGGHNTNTLVYEMNGNGTFYRDDKGNKVHTGPDKDVEVDSNVGSQASGKGANMMIKKSFEWLWYHCGSPAALLKKPVKTINLCGFSRGSVNAVVAAYFIDAVLKPRIPTLTVNMFVFDPVKGSGGANEYNQTYHFDAGFKKYSFGVDIHKLPPVVQDFKATVAANMAGTTAGVISKDWGFQSTLPTQNKTPNYEVVVMPGGHNSGTKYNLENKGSNMGRIGISMAQEFLSDHGSQFSANYVMSTRQTVEAYAIARNPGKGVKAKDDFAFFDKKGHVKTSKRRAEVAGRYNDWLDHGFFVNNQHAKALKKVLPDLEHRLRMGQVIGPNDFTATHKFAYPETYDALVATGYLSE